MLNEKTIQHSAFNIAKSIQPSAFSIAKSIQPSTFSIAKIHSTLPKAFNIQNFGMYFQGSNQ